ncbi:MAG: sugar phosphate isomerase/epimerase family protein [Candidatus Sumerlaeota bacterium]
MSYKVGLIGMIREELEKDKWGTLKRVAEMGYQGVEGGIMVSEDKAEMKENRKRMDDLGLATVALSCSQYKEEELDQAIENAHILGVKYIVTYWADPQTEDEVKEISEHLERMAVKCNAAELDFIYHNHEHEFIPRFGEKGNACFHEMLFDNTEALKFELDVAWCHFGGSDPVALLRRIGHRVPVLHVKDLSDDNIRDHFCAVGCGVVPCFAAMEAAAAKGAEWMVVEQDKPGNLTHFESAMASIFNIREAGLLLP